jgi:uncharacterized protein (DUF3820 family)
MTTTKLIMNGRLTFGKFCGDRLKELPFWYLKWLVRQEWTCKAFEVEYLHRLAHPEQYKGVTSPQHEALQKAKQAVKADMKQKHKKPKLVLITEADYPLE